MRFIYILLVFLLGCSSVFKEPKYHDIVLVRPIKNERKNAQQVQKRFDIERCIEEALKGNPNYKMVLHRIETAKATLLGAKSSFFPVANIRWRYFHADSAGTFFSTKLEQRKFSLSGNLNDPGDFGSSNLSFNIMHQLNLAGREILQYKMTKATLDIHRFEEQKYKNILFDAIVVAYYELLKAKKFVSIAKQSVDTVKSQLNETEVKFKGGSALKSDVLSLKVRLALANENVVKAKNRYALMLNILAKLMGFDPHQHFEVIEKDWHISGVPEHYEKGIKVALLKRPELKQARKQILVSRYGVDIAKSFYFPNIELFGKYYYEDRDLRYSRKQANWQVGIAINWDVFNFRTYTNVKKSKALLKEMITFDRKATLEVKHEVSIAYLNLQEAKEREKVLKLAVTRAEENLSLVKKQFEGGAATITKYLNAELALTNSRFQLTSAKYDLKKAKASVGKALGLFSEKRK